MKAIILNAGKDTFESFNDTKPKCLVEIEGNSLLEVQINILYKCGVSDVAVVRGYKKEKINIPGIKYYDNDDYEDTNVLHSLFCARSEMNDEVLILYGDILFDENTIKILMESKSNISVGVMVNLNEALKHKKKIEYKDLEMLSFDSENRVKCIGKNLKLNNQDNIGLFMGMIKCTVKGAEILKRNYDRLSNYYSGQANVNKDILKKSWITDLLNEMTYIGIPLNCVMFEKGWIEINTIDDYNRAISDRNFICKLVKLKTDWGQRSKTYDKITWVNKNDTLDTMVQFGGNLNGKKILDLGTGTGKVLKTLKASYPDGSYYGVDLSKEMMDNIDKKYGFNLRVSKIEDLSCFENNFFDVVTGRMVLHHSENLNKALQEVNRILKPGGKFIVCEGTPPDRYSVSFYEEMFKFKEERHTFLLDDITNLMIKHNFKDITSKTIVLNDMSLNNWLNNAGVPFRNVDIIRKMHFEADLLVKEAYDMKIIEENDILMDWKFVVASGVK